MGLVARVDTEQDREERRMSDKRRDELALLLYRRFGTGHPANSDLWRWHADAVLSLLAKHAVEED